MTQKNTVGLHDPIYDSLPTDKIITDIRDLAMLQHILNEEFVILEKVRIMDTYSADG
jgi:hypothetical protein